MKDYHIFQNCKLDADEHVLRISGDKKRRLPMEEIAGLHLLAGTGQDLTTRCSRPPTRH